MEQVTMTVHEALCEKKVAEKRINKAIRESTFVSCVSSDSTKVDGIPRDEYEKKIRASYQSIQDMLRRNAAMNKAISLSNASTKVTVGDQEMTVAEAIYMHKFGLSPKKQLLAEMVSQNQTVVDMIRAENGELANKLNKFLANTLGAKDRVSEDGIKSLTEDFKKKSTFVAVDPLDIKSKIITLEEEISQFEIKLDSALQLSNAVTTITFEY